MNFNDLINLYERNIGKQHYIMKKNDSKILLTAVHTVYQKDKKKLSEPYTGAIAQYVGNKINGSYLIKCFDNGVDSNETTLDDFKKYLLEFIQENNIKLVLDIHGAARNRNFDIEFGTLNGLSADFSTIKTLENCFKKNNITKINHNQYFKGGGITQTIFENIDVDVIQLEINRKYRDFDNLIECKKVCDSLIDFANKYSEYV